MPGKRAHFKKVEAKSKPLYVAEQIIQAINKGEYNPGDKLPPERALAEEMGVSRSSVREALSALQVLGIIESRLGDGTYVRNLPEPARISEKILPLLAESDSPSQIFEARNALEMGVIALAVENATPEAIADVKAALEKMRAAAAAADFEGYLAANLEFHLAIARATGNPIIVHTVTRLWEHTSQKLLNEMLKDYWQNNIQSSLEIHEQILNAIEERNVKLAWEATRRHYQEPRDYLLSKGGEAAGE